MAYTMTEADKLYYNAQPKKTLPPLMNNPSTGFNALGSTNTNPVSGNYSYAPGSAQGPLNYNQMQQAQQTGTANIVPATTQSTQNTTPTSPYDELMRTLKDKYSTDSKDNTQVKTDMIDKQKAADLQALKDSIAARTSDINNQIAGAGEKFQPMRNNVDVTRAQDLQRAKELMASQGVFGGDNLTAQMNVNNQASQNMSGVDQKQADYENQLRAQIAALQDASTQQQAGVISKASSDKLAAIENEANRLSGVDSSYVANLAKIIGDIQTQNNSDRDYNRNIANDKVDSNYKNGVLTNTAAKNFYDYNTEIAKNKTTEAKNMADATGYTMPSFAQTQIPDSVLQQLVPYSGNYAQAANDLYKTNPDLAKWAQIASVQKMFNNPDLLNQYGQQYATLDNKKYLYGVAKDNRDFNYTANRDNVKDQQWIYDYNLKDFIAKDASARGWDSNATAKTSAADSSARGWASVNLANDKFQYDKQQDSEHPKASPSFNELYGQLGNMVKSMGDNAKYVQTPGSVENKQFTTAVMNAIKNKIITQNEGEAMFNTFNAPY